MIASLGPNLTTIRSSDAQFGQFGACIIVKGTLSSGGLQSCPTMVHTERNRVVTSGDHLCIADMASEASVGDQAQRLAATGPIQVL